MMELDAQFWAGLLAVIGIDLVLAGDNAVVIALAARNLPPHQQRRAVVFGALAAIVLRAALTAVVVFLLQVPFLKLVGGLLLLQIGYKLATEEPDDHEGIDSVRTMRGAITTILMADVVMSLDNVLAVAAAAHGNIWLIVFGLALSIPIVMGGASLLIKVIDRFPILVWIGALLIVYVGAELILADEFLHEHLLTGALLESTWVHRIIGLGIGLLVMGIAYARVRSRRSTHARGLDVR